MSLTLVWQDNNVATTMTALWGQFKTQVQGVLDLYTATGLPALVNAEFSSLFNDTENLIFDKMTGVENGLLTFGEGESSVSLPVNRSEAMKLLQKPVGYDALIAGIDALKERLKSGGYKYSVNQRVQLSINNISAGFIIDEGGELQYSTYVAGLIANYGKTFIKTAKAKAVHQFIKDVVQAYYDNGIDVIRGSGIPGGNGSMPELQGVIMSILYRLAPGFETGYMPTENLKKFDDFRLNSGDPESED